VRRTCLLLNHPIQVDAERKKGARFYLTLKKVPPVEKTESSALISINPLEGKTLLIIDDDPLILDALGSLLDQWHCQVMTADSLQTAIELCKGQTPDAIICDYRLKEYIRGNQAINAVRQALGKNIPAMLLTGDTSPKHLSKLHKTGFTVLHKPVQPAQLRATLTHLIRTNA